MIYNRIFAWWKNAGYSNQCIFFSINTTKRVLSFERIPVDEHCIYFGKFITKELKYDRGSFYSLLNKNIDLDKRLALENDCVIIHRVGIKICETVEGKLIVSSIQRLLNVN